MAVGDDLSCLGVRSNSSGMGCVGVLLWMLMCNSCKTFLSWGEEALDVFRGGVQVDSSVLSFSFSLDSSDSESDQNKSRKDTSLKN